MIEKKKTNKKTGGIELEIVSAAVLIRRTVVPISGGGHWLSQPPSCVYFCACIPQPGVICLSKANYLCKNSMWRRSSQLRWAVRPARSSKHFSGAWILLLVLLLFPQKLAQGTETTEAPVVAETTDVNSTTQLLLNTTTPPPTHDENGRPIGATPGAIPNTTTLPIATSNVTEGQGGETETDYRTVSGGDLNSAGAP